MEKEKKKKEAAVVLPKKEGVKKVAKAIAARGRTFQGVVIRKFPTRVTIELERTVYLPKYERFFKKKTKIHAHLPKEIDVNEGDLIKVKECRPLSKMIHHIVIEIVEKAEENNNG
jgi:small subunit ribosomal protein S17